LQACRLPRHDRAALPPAGRAAREGSNLRGAGGREAEMMHVRISRSDDRILLATADDSIEIRTDNWRDANKIRNDFAVWFFLPIAMRTGQALHVEGEGSEATIENARRISESWESWLPHHFNSVDVSFDDLSRRSPGETGNKRSLCLYSGGIDSTHALLSRHRMGEEQDLLTVHGMEYRLKDEEKFHALKSKIATFSRLVGDGHIFVRMNAYDTYRKYTVNLPGAPHVSHIFALAGCTFMFSERYQNIFIASDCRLDQQFRTPPWGSNSATNPHFNDGCTRLNTLDDHLTRTEKMPLILSSREALNSVSFCNSYRTRPDNCGRCDKCMRTKLMFFAASGTVPEIFSDSSIPSDWYRNFDLGTEYQRVILLDILTCAKRNSRFSQVPNAQALYSALKSPAARETAGTNGGRRRALEVLAELRKGFSGLVSRGRNYRSNRQGFCASNQSNRRS
jgi:hypothetical protein